jgi:hypothetical protein
MERGEEVHIDTVVPSSSPRPLSTVAPSAQRPFGPLVSDGGSTRGSQVMASQPNPTASHAEPAIPHILLSRLASRGRGACDTPSGHPTGYSIVL